jgi:MFS transporter, DHA1 family, tetracycline resistance protein
VLRSAIAALGLDYPVMELVPTLGWLFLGRSIAGIAGASFTPAYAYVAGVSPPERRAQSFGVVSACFGLGFIIGHQGGRPAWRRRPPDSRSSNQLPPNELTPP